MSIAMCWVELAGSTVEVSWPQVRCMLTCLVANVLVWLTAGCGPCLTIIGWTCQTELLTIMSRLTAGCFSHKLCYSQGLLLSCQLVMSFWRLGSKLSCNLHITPTLPWPDVQHVHIPKCCWYSIQLTMQSATQLEHAHCLYELDNPFYSSMPLRFAL